MQNKNNDLITVPYIVYESEQSRSERHIKRLISTLIILIAIVFASNLAWLYAWCQYDYTSSSTIEATQDGEGINIVGGGNVEYGSNGEND